MEELNENPNLETPEEEQDRAEALRLKAEIVGHAERLHLSATTRNPAGVSVAIDHSGDAPRFRIYDDHAAIELTWRQARGVVAQLVEAEESDDFWRILSQGLEV